MATKKQIEALNKKIEKLQEQNRKQKESIDDLSQRLMEQLQAKYKVFDKAQQDMLEAHNAMKGFIQTVDECDGDFFMSELTRMRRAVREMQSKYQIQPPKDNEGNSLPYHTQWVIGE